MTVTQGIVGSRRLIEVVHGKVHEALQEVGS